MREHNLTDQERRAVVQDILLAFRVGTVPHRAYARLARKHECHRHTVERIWARYCGNVADGVADGAPESRINQKSGRKPYDRAELAAKIGAVSVAGRRRIERTAAAVGVSTGLLHLLLKEGHMIRRTTRIKPQLTDIQKLARMRYTDLYRRAYLRVRGYVYHGAYGQEVVRR
ncbi:hypothetical protein F442_01410 [Phytophthora nicotianae P10297]|uniref:Transposase Tc1-like domain-containing protein n=1 Tax=Phytophthora nicotianae P10297 TaxID=1317064 RepID=W3A262_PHYNI|nr:hypothetical protein F442_01410 [Phytophthora nicotianae P10297]